MAKFYGMLLEQRLRADYEDLVEFTEEQVKDWLKRAEEFINMMTDLVSYRIEELSSDRERGSE